MRSILAVAFSLALSLALVNSAVAQTRPCKSSYPCSGSGPECKPIPAAPGALSVDQASIVFLEHKEPNDPRSQIKFMLTQGVLAAQQAGHIEYTGRQALACWGGNPYDNGFREAKFIQDHYNSVAGHPNWQPAPAPPATQAPASTPQTENTAEPESSSQPSESPEPAMTESPEPEMTESPEPEMTESPEPEMTPDAIRSISGETSSRMVL